LPRCERATAEHYGLGSEVKPVAAVERIRHTEDSQGHTLASTRTVFSTKFFDNRFRAKGKQQKILKVLSPVGHGQNLALTVLHVPYSLDSGFWYCSAKEQRRVKATVAESRTQGLGSRVENPGSRGLYTAQQKSGGAGAPRRRRPPRRWCPRSPSRAVFPDRESVCVSV